MRRVMMTALVTLAMAGPVVAKPSLRDVPQIDDGLFAVGLADRIRKECPQISARFFQAVGFIRALEQSARDLGYSGAEIDAHLDSKAEKNRLRARAADYMASQGLEQTEQGYCALGRAEIAQKSTIGALLRLRE